MVVTVSRPVFGSWRIPRIESDVVWCHEATKRITGDIFTTRLRILQSRSEVCWRRLRQRKKSSVILVTYEEKRCTFKNHFFTISYDQRAFAFIDCFCLVLRIMWKGSVGTTNGRFDRLRVFLISWKVGSGPFYFGSSLSRTDTWLSYYSIPWSCGFSFFGLQGHVHPSLQWN